MSCANYQFDKEDLWHSLKSTKHEKESLNLDWYLRCLCCTPLRMRMLMIMIYHIRTGGHGPTFGAAGPPICVPLDEPSVHAHKRVVAPVLRPVSSSAAREVVMMMVTVMTEASAVGVA